MRKLTLAEWASVAEIIAAVGVVVSLFFVGIEVRRNTSAVQAATLQSVLDIARQQVLLMASNPELNRIAMAGDTAFAKLNAEERIRYAWQDRSFWLGMQTVYRQWQLGVLPNQEWGVYNRIICNNIAVRGTRALWSEEAHILIPEFVSVVEACDSFRSGPNRGNALVP